jgi:hypothetical protein
VRETAASPQARYGVTMEMMTALAIKTQIKRSLLLAVFSSLSAATIVI